ncbi:unnamed protein product [Rotaria magnacalcarata]|uniref:Uncharacterized protein n=1 Tax=Rotaria magnacalcarata TaxID=392030 RepID=A0A816FDV5_9BILA|nr:unnamed protein product [Rotaria magnacalcarata]CAF1660264.1 unnamed protein product [Rotaria magnacalcarata]CAF2083781.1 unnamed protein product [Rotaria magnacalcarata]
MASIPVRIINRGRIGPINPRVSTDSERTNFSSASEVSTISSESIEHKSEEPPTESEKVTNSALSTQNKRIIAVSVSVGLVILTGVILCVILLLTLNKTSATTTSKPLTTVTTTLR